MVALPFLFSERFTLGVELELQIINPLTFDLFPRAKELMRLIQGGRFDGHIKPEITQSMIEINTSAHNSIIGIRDELENIKTFLGTCANKLNLLFSGGGTHPFQKWDYRKIFPSQRFRNLSKKYGYLAKQFTVFGMHVHIGCPDGDEAIYLTHALGRFVPHLIAMSASSPFSQGINTKFHCSRLNSISAFPLSGNIPYVTTWKAFCDYYDRMQKLTVIKSMKDFYWDIKPRPEFGTVEFRVCDTPLSTDTAVMLAGFIQTLSHYLLTEKPYVLSEALYDVYNHNRFQACRFGYDGEFIDPITKQQCLISEDLLVILEKLTPHACLLGTTDTIATLKNGVTKKQNDSLEILEKFKQVKSFSKLMQHQCKTLLT